MTEADHDCNWINEDVALTAHDAMLAEFGGLAGTRDIKAMQSAFARPRNLAAYGLSDAATLAASYAFGLSLNPLLRAPGPAMRARSSRHQYSRLDEEILTLVGHLLK